jgi:hypothetical protein
LVSGSRSRTKVRDKLSSGWNYVIEEILSYRVVGEFIGFGVELAGDT